MLSIKELEEFENYIKSGRLESDFEYGGEKERHALLELLQKIMDAADLADEAATKIIYKGLARPGERQES